MKRVLIIAYYFPPMGGSGVQRPLGLAKYLADFGWKPVVITPEPGIYHTFDSSLIDEVETHNIEVVRVQNGSFFQSAGGKKKIRYSEAKGKLLRLFTSWFMFPDNKKGWIEPAVEKAIQLHKKDRFDALFSTGPPFSNHIIASKIKEETGLPLILDYRDDWLDNQYAAYPTSWHRDKIAELEYNSIQSSNAITVVNSAYENILFKRYPFIRRPIILPNGYDPEFTTNNTIRGANNKFVITYSGLFHFQSQPDQFLKAVTFALKRNPDLAKDIEIQFVGSEGKAYEKLIKKSGLNGAVSFKGYKSHEETVQILQNSDLLLLILSDKTTMRNVTPGKMYEYFGTRKPVLALVPKGISRHLLKRYKAAMISHPNDISMISHELLKFYELWKKNKLPKGDQIFSESFNRKKQSGKLAGILNSVIK